MTDKYSCANSVLFPRSQKVEERDEQCGSNDRPENRKRPACELDGKHLSQPERVGEPRPQHCSNETQRNRHQTATVR